MDALGYVRRVLSVILVLVFYVNYDFIIGTLFVLLSIESEYLHYELRKNDHF